MCVVATQHPIFVRLERRSDGQRKGGSIGENREEGVSSHPVEQSEPPDLVV